MTRADTEPVKEVQVESPQKTTEEVDTPPTNGVGEISDITAAAAMDDVLSSQPKSALGQFMNKVLVDLTADGAGDAEKVAEVTSTLIKGEAPTFQIETKFRSRHTNKPLVVSLRPKQGLHYVVIVPKRLTHNDKRGTLNFSRVQPFGLNVDFAEYVKDALEDVVNKVWTTEVKARKWYQKSWVETTADKYKSDPPEWQHHRYRTSSD